MTEWNDPGSNQDRAPKVPGQNQPSRLDEMLDHALEATFPASDPVSISPPGAAATFRARH